MKSSLKNDTTGRSFVPLYLLNVNQLLQAPEIKSDYSLSGLFNISLPLIAKQRTLLRLWLEREGTTEDFWKNLGKHEDFNEGGLVAEMVFILQLNVLTFSHLPLMKILRRRKNKARFKSIQDLVALQVPDWQKFLNCRVDGRRVGYPPLIYGKNKAKKQLNYATNIFRLLENAFPSRT